MGLWDKFVVPPLISCACATKPIMKQREKVVPLATGKVLELGCGSGTNFGFYDASKLEKLYALEPSPEMMARARKAASEFGWADRIEFLETGAENVPLRVNVAEHVSKSDGKRASPRVNCTSGPLRARQNTSPSSRTRRPSIRSSPRNVPFFDWWSSIQKLPSPSDPIDA